MHHAVAPDLKHHLDAFLEAFPRERHVSNDPVHFVHRYDDPRDREVVGLIASAFAYGNVKSILATVDRARRSTGSGRRRPRGRCRRRCGLRSCH